MQLPIALAATVAFSVSGCAAGTAGHPVASPKETAAATSAAAPAAPVTHNWVDVTGRPELPLPQLSTDPAPGIGVGHREHGVGRSCTLGPAVEISGTTGFLSAGHCRGDQGGEQYLYSPGGDEHLVGSMDPAMPDGADNGRSYLSSGVEVDAGFIAAPVDATDTTIAGRYPIAGVMKAEAAAAAINAPAAAIWLCIDGARGGIRCARGAYAGDDAITITDPDSGPLAEPSDSGAVLFAVDGTGRAALIGLVSERPDSTHTRAVYLDPALTAFGAKAILAH